MAQPLFCIIYSFFCIICVLTCTDTCGSYNDNNYFLIYAKKNGINFRQLLPECGSNIQGVVPKVTIYFEKLDKIKYLKYSNEIKTFKGVRPGYHIFLRSESSTSNRSPWKAIPKMFGIAAWFYLTS